MAERRGAGALLGILLLAVACTGFLPAGSALAQTATPQPSAAQTPPPWQVGCTSGGANEKPVCQMSQTLVAKNTGQRILASVIMRKAGAAGYSLTVGLPHGLSLPAGLNVWVDEGDRTAHAIETADQNGSYATIDLSAAMIDAMRRGSLLNVSVTSVAKEEVIMQLSLAGFVAAIDKL